MKYGKQVRTVESLMRRLHRIETRTMRVRRMKAGIPVMDSSNGERHSSPDLLVNFLGQPTLVDEDETSDVLADFRIEPAFKALRKDR